uniref:Uncharacterized protein n=1 Tax=Oryza barthii TaxID=65489 RepID=A0A0D3EZ27_9ORYZ
MRRQAVVAAALAALAAGILAASLLLLWRCRRRSAAANRQQPAVVVASDAELTVQSPEQAAGPDEEEVNTWRDRWFGPATAAASRALYTIDEESGAGSEGEEEPEPETPFYTPPASPPRLGGGGHSPEATV